MVQKDKRFNVKSNPTMSISKSDAEESVNRDHLPPFNKTTEMRREIYKIDESKSLTNL